MSSVLAHRQYLAVPAPRVPYVDHMPMLRLNASGSHAFTPPPPRGGAAGPAGAGAVGAPIGLLAGGGAAPGLAGPAVGPMGPRCGALAAAAGPPPLPVLLRLVWCPTPSTVRSSII